MPGEEIEHRAKDRRIAQSAAQLVRRQTGKLQQTRRPRLVREGPAERRQSDRLGIGIG